MANEFDGGKYERASAHQKEWGRRLIDELELTGSERILDMGCGDGVLTEEIAALIPEGEVVGIDASRGMIETASAHGGASDKSNLRFLLMDINDMPFVDEFDVIFSNATLHWVTDHATMLERVRRALTPGGRIRFNFAGEGNCSRFFGVVGDMTARAEYVSYFTGLPPRWPWYMPGVDEYRGLVGRAGFREARVWGENADRHFPDVSAMARWIDQPSIVPFLSRLPETLRSSFRDSVVHGMIAAAREPDGRCFETFRRINVSAVK